MDNTQKTVIALFIIFVIWLFVAVAKDRYDFNNKCRASSGVPVHTYGADNCAQSGFIDIK